MTVLTPAAIRDAQDAHYVRLLARAVDAGLAPYRQHDTRLVLSDDGRDRLTVLVKGPAGVRLTAHVNRWDYRPGEELTALNELRAGIVAAWRATPAEPIPDNVELGDN